MRGNPAVIGIPPTKKCIWFRCDLNLWPQNAISSSLSPTAPNLQFW